MGDLLQQGSDWLSEMQHKYASQTVTYRRGYEEISLSATLGKTEYEVEDETGLRVGAEVIDFLLRAEDLVMTGEVTRPQPGDQIVVERGGNEIIYEVMPLSDQGCWRFSDSYGKRIRVHTKLVE